MISYLLLHWILKPTGSPPPLYFVWWSNSVVGHRFWMNYDVAMELLTESGLRHAVPLFEGSFEEVSFSFPPQLPHICLLSFIWLSTCCNFNYNINSTIPTVLGFPPLEKNICEGNIFYFFGNIFKLLNFLVIFILHLFIVNLVT